MKDTLQAPRRKFETGVQIESSLLRQILALFARVSSNDLLNLYNLNSHPELTKHFTADEFIQVLEALRINLMHVRVENLDRLGNKPIVNSVALGIDNDGCQQQIVGRNLFLSGAFVPNGACAEMGMCSMAKSLLVDTQTVETIVIASYSTKENKLFQCCPGCRAYLTELFSGDTKIIFINHKNGKINLAGSHTLKELDPQQAALKYFADNNSRETENYRNDIFIDAVGAIPIQTITPLIPDKSNLILGCVVFEANATQVSGLQHVYKLNDDKNLYVVVSPLEVTKGTKKTLSPAGTIYNATQRLFGKFATKMIFAIDEKREALPLDSAVIAYLQSMLEREFGNPLVVTSAGDKEVILPFSAFYPHPDVTPFFRLDEQAE